MAVKTTTNEVPQNLTPQIANTQLDTLNNESRAFFDKSWATNPTAMPNINISTNQTVPNNQAFALWWDVKTSPNKIQSAWTLPKQAFTPAPATTQQYTPAPTEIAWQPRQSTITKDINWVEQMQPVQQTPDTSDSMFNKMLWASVVPQETPEYKQAFDRKTKFDNINMQTPNQIAQNMVSWSLLPWSQELKDLQKYNPNLYMQTLEAKKGIDNLEKVNKISSDLYKANGWTTETAQPEAKPDEIQQINKTIQDNIISSWWGGDYVEKVKQAMNDPKIQTQREKLMWLIWQRDKINTDMKNLEDEARKALWSEAPESLISAYISSKMKPLNRQYDNLNSQIQSEQWLLNMYVQDQQTMLEAYKYQDDMNFRNKQFNYWMYQDQFNMNRQLNQDQMQRLERMQKNWIVWDYGTAQSREERALVMKNMAQQSWWDIQTYVSAVNSIEDWIPWWQCWMFANDYLSWITWDPTKYFWNDLESKINWINKIWASDVPVVWWLVAYDSWAKWWHVWIVTSVNPDWTFTMKSSNFKNDEKVRTDENISPKWKHFSIAPQAKSQTQAPTKEQTVGNRQLLSKIMWDSRVGGFNDISKSYKGIQSIISWWVNEENKSAADQALITMFNKILDPWSVVKEWEYDRALKWQWISDRMKWQIKKQIDWWAWISDDTREAMLKVVEDLYNTASEWMQDVRWQYYDIATDVWATPEFVDRQFKGYWVDDWQTQYKPWQTIEDNWQKYIIWPDWETAYTMAEYLQRWLWNTQ